jgi:hypothetical protein
MRTRYAIEALPSAMSMLLGIVPPPRQRSSAEILYDLIGVGGEIDEIQRTRIHAAKIVVPMHHNDLATTITKMLFDIP